MQAALATLASPRAHHPQADERTPAMNPSRTPRLAALALALATTLLGLATQAANLTWTGSANGNWNEATTNWSDGVGAVAYNNTTPDAVTFATGSNRTIALAATYSPASIGFNNAAGTDFAFSGGGISGSGALTKAGAGDAIFVNTTDFSGYTGAIGITAGRLLREQDSGTGSFGSGTITLDGGTLGVKYTNGWQPLLTIANPISVTANGGSITGLYKDGSQAAYTGGISLTSGSTLNLEATPGGADGSAYTLTLGAMTLAGNGTIQRNYTDTFLFGGTDGRRQVLLNGAISGVGHTLTLDSINTRLQSTGSFTVGNLNIEKELWVENRGGNAFVTLGAGGKVTVADGGLLALGHTTLAAADLVLESGAQLRHLVGNWSSYPTITGAMTIGANRTVWLSQQAGGDSLNFGGGVTFESGSLLMVAPGRRDGVSGADRSSGIAGTATLLGGSTIEGRIMRANGTAVRSGTLIFGDTDAGTAETITIKGQGAGVMAFVASSATDIGGLTLRYEAASSSSPFKVGWGATGWNGGTGALTASLVGGSAGTEFAPQVGTGDNGKIIAIGTTAGTVFTASQPTTVVSAGTVEFRRSASSGQDNWQAGALGPVVVASGGSLRTAVTGATVVASAINVAGGGSLAGHGTFQATVNVADNGQVTPGTSIGTLTIAGDATFESGARLVIEIDGLTSDQLIVTGQLELLAGAVLEIVGTPTIGTPYVLVSYGSLGGVGEFASVEFSSGKYTVLYGQGDGGNEIWFTAIPEPTSLVLLGLAALALARRRR